MAISWAAGAGRCATTLLAMTGLVAGSAQAQGVCTPAPANPTAQFETNLGNFEVLLCYGDVAPTVDNFIQYVNDGAYMDSSVIHRSIQSTPGVVPRDDIDIVQGGGFWVDGNVMLTQVVARTPILLDAKLPNLAGTIAMARTAAPNSATSQWFINVLDNPSLDATGPGTGYTVFGEVTSGMATVQAMHAQQTWNLNSPVFSDFPLINYSGSGFIALDEIITITNITIAPEPSVAAQGLAAIATVASLAAHRRRTARQSRRLRQDGAARPRERADRSAPRG